MPDLISFAPLAMPLSVDRPPISGQWRRWRVYCADSERVRARPGLPWTVFGKAGYWMTWFAVRPSRCNAALGRRRELRVQPGKGRSCLVVGAKPEDQVPASVDQTPSPIPGSVTRQPAASAKSLM
jgi:hypothetical protein